MSRAWTLSLALALLAGAAAAALLYPGWREGRALSAIASPDASARADGWTWLLEEETPGGVPRAAARIPAINERLERAGESALVDGAARLRGSGLWGWSQSDRALVWRELRALARSPLEADQRVAVASLATCPLDANSARVEAAAGLLLESAFADIRARSFEATAGWAGRDRPGTLLALPVSEDDPTLGRLRALALARCRPIPPPGVDALGTPPAEIGLAEARAVWRATATPDDASSILAHLHGGPYTTLAAFEYALRYTRDPRARRELERRAEAGSDVARYVLHARSRHVDEDQARRVVGEPGEPPSRRRLAAWRWNGIPGDLVATLLHENPTDHDGSVSAAVLLAERRLPRADAVALAERWIRSFDDDEKRAGALLAALLGEHVALLEHAYGLEDIAEVRTTQRLALWAAGRPTGNDDPVEFAHRTLAADDGDFRADTVLCMLLANDRAALERLTSRPTDDALSTRKRAWLIERFVPEWFEEVGRPIGGSRRALALHFDSLDALRLLTQRRLRFDPETKCYRSE